MDYKQLRDVETNEICQGILKIEGASVLSIPNDPQNKDWKAYQEWLAQGNQPLAAD